MTKGISEHHEVICIDHERCDVINFEEVNRIISCFNPDAVVNFSGVCNFQSIKEMDLEKAIDEIYVNLIGAFVIAKCCAENNVKKTIFLGSLSGIIGKQNQAGYGASKRGLISLVQSMSKEGLGAYVISAGRTETKLRNRLFPGEDKKTRLSVNQIGCVIEDCLNDKYKSGDNIIITKFGYETYIRVNNDDPWLEYTKGIT